MLRLGIISLISAFSIACSAKADGMFLPLAEKLPAKQIEELGIQLSPEEIEKMGQNAIVRLNGCSSTFMSPDGLVGTNWHCAYGCAVHIQNVSRNENGMDHPLSNIGETGYVATSQEKELKCEGHEAQVPYEMVNVSDQFEELMKKKGLSPKERADAIRIKRETIREECMQGKEGIVCDVVFMNNETEPYYLFKYRKYTDVRLVWIVPDIVGGFGGNVDNWEYPRHCGDFAFLRVYDDGKPVKSTIHVPASAKGVAPGDPQFILGYPGSTERNITSFEAKFMADMQLPYMHYVYGELMKAIREVSENPKDSAYKGSWARLDNYFENFKRKSSLIQSQGVVANKEADEKKKKGPELQRIEEILDAYYNYFPTLYLLGRMTKSYPTYGLRAASYIWQWNTQPADDKERESDTFKSWNEPQVRFSVLSADDSMTFEGEKELAATYFRLADALKVRIPTVDKLRDETRKYVAGCKKDSTRKKPGYDKLCQMSLYEQMAELLYAGTEMIAKSDSKEERARAKALREKMFEMSPKELEATGDKLLLFAKSLVEDRKEMRTNPKKAAPMVYELPFVNYKNNLIMNYPTPDANFTLRFTASTVQDRYDPIYKEGVFGFATSLGELIDKDKLLNKSHPEYDMFLVPEYLKKAYKNDPGRKDRFYYDENLEDVPINFITQHIITGGNSGSGVFNANGKVVGFAFDGTPESILDDVQLHPHSRTIAVDIRYVGFLGNEVFPDAKRILKEIGLPTY